MLESFGIFMFNDIYLELFQDDRYNHYLVIEPQTKLLRIIRSENFEESTSQFLTWFTVCDYNTLEHFGAPFVCFHCSICLAGFPDKRLFFDGENNIAMLLSKNTNSNHLFDRLFEIDITYAKFSVVNKSWLSCSQGDLRLREQNFAVNCENQCTILRMIQ